MTGELTVSYVEAFSIFRTIPGWKDADEQVYACQKKIKEIKAREEADRLEAEAKRIADEKAAKKRKKIVAITTPIVCACIAFLIVLNMVIIPNNNYKAAVALMDSGNYEEAIAAFEALDGYKDSAAQIENCNTAIKDIAYNDAVALMDSGKYEEAIEAFKALDDYKDSTEKADSAYIQYKAKKLKNAGVGDTVLFGTYEQDNNTFNGKEEIEWLVLAKEDNKILLISEYALDCQQYNTSFTHVTWETCSLCKWMNDTFLNAAFSTEEQVMIQSTTVSADKNPEYSTDPGNATTDKVFLLSITEVEKYFTSDEDRKCVPTAYAIAQGARTADSNTKGGEATCWWWLRSPGKYQNFAASVNCVGSVYYIGLSVDTALACVRPALWISLE